MLIDSTIKMDPTIDLTKGTASLLESDYSLRVNDTNHSLTADQLKALMADARFAADDWFSHFTNRGKIDIEINIGKTAPGFWAQGKAATYVLDHTETIAIDRQKAWNVEQAGTLIEMKTGVDPNGDAPDMIITVDTDFAKSAFLAPNPSFVEGHEFETRGSPAGKGDMISLLLHEMGHGFGIASKRDPGTGELPSNAGSPMSKVSGLISYTETTFDKLVEIHSDGTAWFTGANAQKVYASMQLLGPGAMLPVPVTTLKNGEQYEHFGNDSKYFGVGSDLMNGVGLDKELLYGISALDLAVMQDLGASVKVPVPLPLVSDTSLIGTHNGAVDAAHHLFG